MSLNILKLLAEHGGVIGVLIGIPFAILIIAVAVLYKDGKRKDEKIITLIEQKMETDSQTAVALENLKDVIKATIGRR